MDNKAVFLIGESPSGHLGVLVVEHVGQGDQRVRLDSVDRDAEYPAADDHAGPFKLLIVKLLIVQQLLDCFVVLFDILLFVEQRLQEGGALEFSQQLLPVVEGEVLDFFGEAANVGAEVGVFAAGELLEEEDREHAVLGGFEGFLVGLQNIDLGLPFDLFESDDFVFGDRNDEFVGLDGLLGHHDAVVSLDLPDLHFLEEGARILVVLE